MNNTLNIITHYNYKLKYILGRMNNCYKIHKNNQIWGSHIARFLIN